MTVTQMLFLVIGSLALLLSVNLIRTSVARRRRPVIDIQPGFRQVGTFGSPRCVDREVVPLPNTGSSASAVLVLLAFFALVGGGTVVKFAWDQSHPDIRSGYGRAYEHCVREEGVSRWDVKEVQRCIQKRPRW